MDLILAAREGDKGAYGRLYQRHVDAAHRLARQVTHSRSEAEDVVSESFAKILTLLSQGQGPTDAFRAYVLTAVRHTAYDKSRKQRKQQPTDDMDTVPHLDLSQPFGDPAVEDEDRASIAAAFARLPQRWQMVLWHVEIEGETPATVAPLLGMTPNSVSALAYRAREGLKQQYLQVHLMRLGDADQACRTVIDRLGAWTRDGLSKRDMNVVNRHMEDCVRCGGLAAELVELNGTLKVAVAPVILGSGAAGYVAVSSGVVGTVVGTVRTHPKKATAASAALMAMLMALAAVAARHEEPVAAEPPESPPATGDHSSPTPPPAPPVPVAPPVPAPPPTPQPDPAPVPPDSAPEKPGPQEPPLPPLPDKHVVDMEVGAVVPVLDVVRVRASVHADLDTDRVELGVVLDVESGDGVDRRGSG